MAAAAAVPASSTQNNIANTSKPLAEKKVEGEKPATSAPAAAAAAATDGGEKESGPCGLPKGCIIL